MVENGERILGVLGGMGPLASAHFMARLTLLTPATRDQDQIPAVLWSDPRVPPRLRDPGTEDPWPWLRRGLRGLQQAGCGAVAIPCNTAHGWYDQMKGEGLPILHIVEAAAAELRHALPVDGKTGATIGLMGTATTLAMRLYQDPFEELGWRCIEPSREEMAASVTPAIAMVKANRVAEAYAPLATVARSLAARGAGAVVLGCTEIPLGILAGPYGEIGIPLVDTIDALALAAIRWAKPGLLESAGAARAAAD
jgi:aspartate racemase